MCAFLSNRSQVRNHLNPFPPFFLLAPFFTKTKRQNTLQHHKPPSSIFSLETRCPCLHSSSSPATTLAGQQSHRLLRLSQFFWPILILVCKGEFQVFSKDNHQILNHHLQMVNH
ncbi:hypothetical protein HanPSC8_Chr09g0392871 [Helianthus annuus]|nr:hypothetical protein HanPSC8_Chr09g0392871 [Helianthus annuus]